MPHLSTSPTAIVVGAGLGGLAAAVCLAVRGVRVVVLESQPQVGGKMRQIAIDGRTIDGGPTVLTLPEVLAELFEFAGHSLQEHLQLEPLTVLARHQWKDGSCLDLMSDREDAATAIERFAGSEEADGYLRFCAYARRILEAVEGPFIRSSDPSLVGMMRSVGFTGLAGLWGVDWRRTMWRSLDDFFADSRMHQLFARYATYTGSSPLTAPATLNLVAAVEQRGVYRVVGGMYRVAEALAALAVRLGVSIMCSTPVRSIVVDQERCRGVRIEGQEVLADMVVFNGDRGALPGLLSGLCPAKHKLVTGHVVRSLSAHTFAVLGQVSGWPLHHHNVLFSSDYRHEFEQLSAGHTPDDPTVYICAQDRSDGRHDGARPERLLVLINTPARGDEPRLKEDERLWRERTFARIRAAGIDLTSSPDAVVETSPWGFAGLFPGSAGALYGIPTRGWTGAFRRRGAKTEIPGLYLAGGGVHPGAGVPMVMLSGRFAANLAWADLSSMRRSFLGATVGGTQTASPTMANERSV